MGVVISGKPALRRQRSIAAFLVLVLLAVGTLTIYAVATYRFPIADWSVTQLARAIQRGEVERLSFAGNHAMVDTNTGIRALVFSPTGGTIIRSLRDLGVPEESLSVIEIVRHPPSRFGPSDFLQRLFQWFWGVPIVILVGAGGFALRHAHKSRQTT